MERQTLVAELHKPARRNYPRRKFDVRGYDETWQADLVEMIPYAKKNRGFRYLLTVIDVFSKFAWAIPVKRKNGEDVTAAMRSILKDGRVPKNLQTDQGKEFYNANFEKLMEEFKIHLYSSYSNLKASIIERLNRTLKNRMWIQFSLNGNYKWLNILPELVRDYNNRKHRTIGMKPVDVSKENEREVLKKFPHHCKIKKQKFKVGDKVRISKAKRIFEKGYTPGWSTEIFSIVKVSATDPVMYYLKDYQDQPIARGFYEQEIQKVKYSDVYLVEKILKKRYNRLFVKWLGFDKSHNGWIDKKDLTAGFTKKIN